jgi:hypothetical protein
MIDDLVCLDRDAMQRHNLFLRICFLLRLSFLGLLEGAKQGISQGGKDTCEPDHSTIFAQGRW